MKKYAIFITMIMIVFILGLTACSGDSPLSKEEVISEIEARMNQVENYHTEGTVSIVLTDLQTDTIIENSEGNIRMDMIETTMESSGESINDTETLKHYMADGASYIQINDEPWADSPEHADTFNDTHSTYKEIAQIMIDLQDEEAVKMEEKDGSYRFTFNGKSASIYTAFEDPYSLGLTGATPDEMEQDLTIIVDSETFFLKQVNNSFTVEKEGVEMRIAIEQSYEKINEIEEIFIPQEVVDEANEAKFGSSEQQGNEDVNSEIIEVITNVAENIDSVENYHTDATIQIDIIDVTTNDSVDSSQAILDIDMIEEPMESSGQMIEGDVAVNYYATTDATYVQTDDQQWEDHTDQPDQFDHSNTLYKDVAQVLVDLQSIAAIQMEENNGKYIFSFTGKSEAIYNAFETPYSLGLTGATPDEMEQDMTFIIDRETYIVEQIKNTFTVEKEGIELSILIDQTYDRINEIDTITIPKEVIDQANER